MPFIETPTELAEALADLLGIYGAHEEDEPKICRVCFVSDMTMRIGQSVINELRLLEKGGE